MKPFYQQFESGVSAFKSHLTNKLFGIFDDFVRNLCFYVCKVLNSFLLAFDVLKELSFDLMCSSGFL